MTPARPAQPRDLLEHWLTELWAAALKRPPTSIDDTPAAHGATPAQIATLHQSVVRETTIALATDDLQADTSVRELAWTLRERGRPLSVQPCRSFDAANDAVPLLWLHGDPNGAGHYCTRLAAALGPRIRLHALASFGTFGPAPACDVATMAEAHLLTLLAVQPAGPYRLGGYCLGGVIMLEVARLLRKRGEQVELLVLLGPRVWSRYWRLRRLCAALGVALGTTREQRLFFAVRDRVQPWFALLDHWRARRAGIDLERLPRPVRLRSPRRWLRRRPAARPHDAALRDPREQARLASWQRLTALARLHIPGHWAGRALILWPEHERVLRYGDPLASWRRRLPRLQVREIAGDHNNALATHLDATAAALREALLASANGTREHRV